MVLGQNLSNEIPAALKSVLQQKKLFSAILNVRIFEIYPSFAVLFWKQRIDSIVGFRPKIYIYVSAVAGEQKTFHQGRRNTFVFRFSF